MALDVVDGDERQAIGQFGEAMAIVGESARGVEADEERTRQARPGGDGDRVEVVPAAGGVGECLSDDRDDRGEVCARGNLGDDAAGHGVQRHLAGDH